MKKKILFYFLIIPFLVLCQEKKENQNSFLSISGQVVDAIDENRVKGIHVNLIHGIEKKTTLTDDFGNFWFQEVDIKKNENYRISIEGEKLFYQNIDTLIAINNIKKKDYIYQSLDRPPSGEKQKIKKGDLIYPVHLKFKMKGRSIGIYPKGKIYNITDENIAPPIYPGCEKLSKKQKFTCFEQNILEYLDTKSTLFEIPKKTNKKYYQIQLEFIINRSGKTCYAKIINGINYNINNEILTLLHSLPNMNPANMGSYNINLVYKLSFNVKKSSSK